MNFKLDQTLAALAPWDLTIDYLGKTFVTARPSIGLIARLNEATSVAKEHHATFAEMFAEPLPSIEEWAQEAIIGARSVFLKYFNACSKKNCEAVTQAATDAMQER